MLRSIRSLTFADRFTQPNFYPMIQRTKVTVVGAGNVGATCADVLATREVCNEVVLLDIKEGFAEGKAPRYLGDEPCQQLRHPHGRLYQ